MNHRERFHAVMNFQPVDRLPWVEWASWWDKTLDRWFAEGLDAPRDRYALYEYFGLDPYFQHWFSPRGPSFPRVAHGQPVVRTMDEYEALKHAGGLFPPLDGPLEGIAPWAVRQRAGQAVIWITLEGFFWWPRALLGIENHLLAFYDQPELMHRINADLCGFHLETIRRLAPVCRPDFMTFAEDMSYNHGPMLSRGLFEEFVAPYYHKVIPALKELGTRVLVDTDGDVTAMAPWLLSAGIEGVLPLERQAGVDAGKLRAAFPKLLMIGHFDKMVMNRGEAAIRVEYERLLPVMRSGGFVPGVDHQTPPGVSLEEYRAYLRLMREYTRGH